MGKSCEGGFGESSVAHTVSKWLLGKHRRKTIQADEKRNDLCSETKSEGRLFGVEVLGGFLALAQTGDATDSDE